jgi:hypothetical protein
MNRRVRIGEATNALFSKVVITFRVMQFHLAERDEYEGAKWM